jgi:hypothetical protein
VGAQHGSSGADGLRACEDRRSVSKKKKNNKLAGLRRLTKAEKKALLPVLGERAALLYALVREGMVRQPSTDEQCELARRLADAFPKDYVIEHPHDS